MRSEQWAHQAAEYADHRNDRGRALIWQPRTGKTRQIIDTACHLWSALEIWGVLVIAPNGIHRQWIEEQVPRHGWVGISTFCHAWRSSRPAHNEVFTDYLRMHRAYVDKLHWYAVNMEVLIKPEVGKQIALFFRAMEGRVMVVYDESHHFGRPGAKRTAVARGIARLASYNRILTGTPTENSPLSAFTQYELLRREALGFRTMGDFKRQYAVYEQRRLRGGRQYPALSHYQNLDELRERMAPYTSVVRREDCADLPATQVVPRFIELTATQLKWWEQAKDEAIEFLEDRGQTRALNGGAALIKLQQIEGGHWLRPDRTVEVIEPAAANPKMLALIDELSGYDGQVLVWFQYIHELEAAHAALDGHAGRYHGSAPDRERDLVAFKAGRLRVMLAQPAAAGEGRDLSGKSCRLIVWYSQTPDARLRRQANERATVKGGRGVQVVDLYAPGGTDAHWLKITEDKADRAESLSRTGMIELLKRLKI